MIKSFKHQLFPLLLACIWPLGQLLEIPLPLEGAHLYALDILAGLSLIFTLFSLSKIKKLPLSRPFLIFLLIALVSLLLKTPFLGLSQLLIAALYLLRLISYFSFYFTLTLYFDLSPRSLSWILLIFTLLGLGQYLFLPDTRFLKYLGFDDHYFRLIGSLLDPNFTGAVLGSAVFLFLASFSGYFQLLALLPLTGLAFTFSRSSYLSFFLALVYLFFTKFKKQYLLLLPVLLLFIFLAPKPFGAGVNLARTFSIHSRWQTLTQQLSTVKQHPVFGVGYNTLRDQASTFYPDRATGSLPNSYLYITVTTGLAGLSSLLYFIYKILISSRSALLIAALLLLLTHSLFNNTLFYNWTLTLFLALTVLSQRE